LAQLLKECCEDKPQVPSDEDELFTDDDSEEAMFENDDNSVDNMLGTSVLSTVSGIAARRRASTARHSHKRRRHSTARESVASTEVTNRQLTGTEKVETGRVSFLSVIAL
jgi:hypothetical protein